MVKVPVVEDPPPAAGLPHEGEEVGGGTGVPGATAETEVQEDMPEMKEEKEGTEGAAASTGPQEEEPEPLAGALYAKP
eukprot:3981851-Prorocentrum_lima.AAC.1